MDRMKTKYNTQAFWVSPLAWFSSSIFVMEIRDIIGSTNRECFKFSLGRA